MASVPLESRPPSDAQSSSSSENGGSDPQTDVGTGDQRGTLPGNTPATDADQQEETEYETALAMSVMDQNGLLLDVIQSLQARIQVLEADKVEVDALRTEIATLKRVNGSLRAVNDSLRCEATDMERQNASLTEERQASYEARDNADAGKTRLEVENQSYRIQMGVLTGLNNELEDQTTTLTAEVSALHAESAEMRTANNTLSRDLDQAHRHNRLLNENNEALNGNVRTLTVEKAALITENETLREAIGLLQRANADLKKDLDKITEIQKDILPFVRDLYGVALRTLADGVLYAAGWDGRGRADFLYTRGRHLERLFGNRFTRYEITATIK
jgi:chromosome segregation ATPase